MPLGFSAIAELALADSPVSFVPPSPPPPTPIPYVRGRTAAVYCPQGPGPVAVFLDANAYNPLVVGTTLAIQAGTDTRLSPNTTAQHLSFTKPDGTTLNLTYPLSFAGQADIVTMAGLFPAGTYLVGSVYLDQPGAWSVQIVKTPVLTAPGKFFVAPG